MKKTMLKVVVCAMVVAMAGWAVGSRTHLFAAAVTSANGLASEPAGGPSTTPTAKGETKPINLAPAMR